MNIGFFKCMYTEINNNFVILKKIRFFWYFSSELRKFRRKYKRKRGLGVN